MYDLSHCRQVAVDGAVGAVTAGTLKYASDKLSNADFGFKAYKGADGTVKLPETQFTTRKLQHEFKHASDYGITGNWNNTNKVAFKNAIKNQMNSVKNPIIGTYRGNMKVYHFYDVKTGLNTMIDKSGNFVGGWKLSADQMANLLRSGNIQ